MLLAQLRQVAIETVIEQLGQLWVFLMEDGLHIQHIILAEIKSSFVHVHFRRPTRGVSVSVGERECLNLPIMLSNYGNPNP